MKYSIIYQLNINCVEVNVSVELTTDVVENKRFAEELSKITGVTKVLLKKQSLEVEKAVEIKWKDIIPEVIMIVLLYHCQWDEIAVEIVRPKKCIVGSNGVTKYKTIMWSRRHKYSIYGLSQATILKSENISI